MLPRPMLHPLSSLAVRFRRAALIVASGLTLLACGAADEPAPAVPVATARPVEPKAPVVAAPVEEEGGPVAISSADPTWGSRRALVTIVELADFQCPYCARASATIEALKRSYGPDKIRVVWKHLPLEFHPEARPAAEVAAAVMIAGGSDAFFKFHDQVFQNQLTLSRDSYDDWVRTTGADASRVRAALSSGAARAKVEQDLAQAKQLGVSGTPAFFINGVSVMGAQPLEAFAATIDQEIAKARLKLGAGVAAEKLYATVAAENWKAPAAADDDDKPDTKTYRIPVGKSPVRGPQAAPVTVVVFSDFQCPFCKRAEATLAELETRYPGSLRFVWKNLPLPFHPRAEPAAQLALEARAQKGDEGFWKAHAKLFESAPALEDGDLQRIARELSLDVAKVTSAIKTHKHRAEIAADEGLADDFQASGTPHFFINGKRLVGARPVSEFVALVEPELARAKAAIAGGVSPAGVYEALTKDGVPPAAPEEKTVSVVKGAPLLGSASAAVTVHVFSDFQCPFCSRVEPTLADLRKEYGTKIRFAWHNLPLSFHEHAHLAAEAAMEAQAQKGDAAFWKMHDALFAHQSDLAREGLEQHAKTIGLDPKRFAAALDGGTHKARVDAEIEAASRSGVSGTPTFLVVREGKRPADAAADSITGYLVTGAQPIGRFRKVIDRALGATASDKVGGDKPADVKAAPKVAPKPAPAPTKEHR